MIKKAGVEGVSALTLWSDKTSFIRFRRCPPAAHPLDEVADLLKGLIACPHAWYSAPDWTKAPRLLNTSSNLLQHKLMAHWRKMDFHPN